MKNKEVLPAELNEDALNDISGGLRIVHNMGHLRHFDDLLHSSSREGIGIIGAMTIREV